MHRSVHEGRRVTVIVLLPAFNEEGKVGETVDGILRHNRDLVDEVLVVNDASSDATASEAEKAGASVISHAKNMGAGAAIRSGIEYAIKRGYEVCVVMGADAQDDPRKIRALLEPILNEHYDLVQGSRYLDGSVAVRMPLFRALTTKLFTFFFRVASGFPVTDASNGFRAFRLRIFEQVNIPKDGQNRYRLEPSIFLETIRNGFKVKEVPVTKSYNIKKGYSKMIPLRDWFDIAQPVLAGLLKRALK